MICDICGKEGARVRYVTRSYGKGEDLLIDEIFYSVLHGEIIEDYPSDKPYPSCLIYGDSFAGEPIHSVWAYNYATQWAVLVTVYRPDPERWIDWRIRRKNGDEKYAKAMDRIKPEGDDGETCHRWNTHYR